MVGKRREGGKEIRDPDPDPNIFSAQITINKKS